MLGAVILAGGRATRLGGIDKPAVAVGGRTLLAAVVAAARTAGAGQVVVVGPEQPGLAARFVREDPPGDGPVPALRRGLDELASRAGGPGAPGQVAVLAADLPFLRAADLRALLAAADGRNGAVLADDEGHRQWLIGCWDRRALSAAAAGYPGSSLRGLMTPLDPAPVVIDLDPGEPPPWLDCDTGADLDRARGWGQRRPGTTTLSSG
ncbi:MAG: NTP transferase domain-containing protein [Actinobacteria bacterium]|nr:NTP transferase domain-containing protein [Actinomycetota bacterium]